MSRQRRLTTQQMEQLLDQFSNDDSSNDDFSASESEYCPSEPEESQGSSNENFESEEEQMPEEQLDQEIDVDITSIWSQSFGEFQPKKVLSTSRPCQIKDIQPSATEMQVFYKLFPPSLIMYIAQCTNERLDIYRASKKVQSFVPNTDSGEIKKMIGCMFIMAYNHVPAMSHYWSKQLSVENKCIKDAFSRDRFILLSSKMYFAPPDKGVNSSKTYYVDDLVQCLKGRYMNFRQDSAFQSIDESMTKFKGRSSMKQYMPLKPTKRGIKMWMRCDSLSGYTYDFNIYKGKEQGSFEGTLGERVVMTLASSIKEKDVTICCDRFFTSVDLFEKLNFAAVGTVNQRRKKMPKITKKLTRGEYEFRVNNAGLICTKWQDTKEVMLLSNCHTNAVTTVTKTLSNGTKIDIPCPQMIKCYRDIMGGVDLADQMAGIYEIDRKSCKWWKKVFQRLLMVTAVNAWIIFKELKKKKIPFITFLMILAEQIVEDGKQTATVTRSTRSGRRLLKRKAPGNVSMHLPTQIENRRRCVSCAANKVESRTKTICMECQEPLCKVCFTPYHMK